MLSRFHRVTWAAAFTATLVLGPQVFAQSDDADPEMRIEQLENQLRQLTGQNEELQHQNQLLQERLRALQGGAQVAPGPQPVQPGAPAPNYAVAAPAQPGPAYNPPPQQGYGQQPIAAPAPIYQEEAPAQGQRRGDAFDPSQNPNAPGAPRPLGGGQMPVTNGAPGGRAPGEPLNLGYPGANNGGGGPPPNAADAGSLTTLPPSATPRDEFDLGIGYMERKDYALAEQTMRNFAQKYPGDPLVADSQYWLGESLYQRQQYRDAAEAFLAVTTKYDKSAKAPDALLRLGQSLAALKEKEAACAALGEVTRKYPRASSGVKAAVDREQKRSKC
ncbi:tol-pal system protein YbgF [Bradyrhizobium sp. dw_78]|uniref:tol-pal system protein YbgF n=1 Tax=Bradyrhizobium sp. dw_78 TaxID=2719793 RepID=UPI001BD54328|nr:tol-pal system protein YbgF [Bradyrhizobium sp. dw_78]